MTTRRSFALCLLAGAWLILPLPELAASARESFRVGTITVPSGEMRSGFLAIPQGPDGDAPIPVTVFNGAETGPALALIAGTHGYEYPPILASQRLIGRIDPKLLKGRLILVHVANMPSFLKRTVYYSPVDGKNLNRVFPGRRDGTLSERIAWTITTEVIERADYLVDMHCGDGNESLRPYSYWMPLGDPKVDEPARQMALAFGLPNIVIDRGRPKDPSASLYCSNTGMTRGKPSVTIESGDMGVAHDEEAIAAVVRGAENLMRHLGMLAGEARMPEQVVWYDSGEVLRFPENLAEKAGLFFPLAVKTQIVEKGALLGYITDFFGRRFYELRSPVAGELLYIIGTPPVSAGEPLAFVAAIRK